MVLERRLAALHKQSPEEEVLSPEFRRQLDELDAKCAEDRLTLVEEAIAARDAVARRGVRVRLIEILTALNQGISEDVEDNICKDAFDLYVRLQAGG